MRLHDEVEGGNKGGRDVDRERRREITKVRTGEGRGRVPMRHCIIITPLFSLCI